MPFFPNCNFSENQFVYISKMGIFIRKPIDKKEFTNTVKKLLK